MEYLEKIVLGEVFNTKGFNSVLFVVLVLLLRSIFTGLILRTRVARDEKRRWGIVARNWSTSILVVGLIVIWSTEIQTFAISLAALGVAIAITLKELIMCVTGGMLQSFQQTFKIGDRIEVDGVRGDVIDSNLFITKILEIGPHNLTHQYTGRAISLPNSAFLSHKIINESFMTRYVLHVFVVPFSRDENWKRAEEIMIKAANVECQDFIDGARKHMQNIARKEGLEMTTVEPRIRYHLSRKNEMEMIIRIPAPAPEKGTVEQRILRRFMDEYLVYGEK
jgi:small-conductance mechanosensitive channel